MRKAELGPGHDDNNSIHLKPPVEEEHLLDDESSVSLDKSIKDS